MSDIQAIRSFVLGKLQYAEKTEIRAMEGSHEREKARNAGKACAFEMVLKKIDEVKASQSDQSIVISFDQFSKAWEQLHSLSGKRLWDLMKYISETNPNDQFDKSK